MAIRMHLSFADEEQDLYEWTKRKKGPSNFIKTLLEAAKLDEEQRKHPVSYKPTKILKV